MHACPLLLCKLDFAYNQNSNANPNPNSNPNSNSNPNPNPIRAAGCRRRRLGYAAASPPEMSLKGAEGCGYTQLTLLNYILLKSFKNC